MDEKRASSPAQHNLAAGNSDLNAEERLHGEHAGVAGVEVLSAELALVSAENSGYNPYDRAGPRLSDIELEARFGAKRRIVPK